MISEFFFLKENKKSILKRIVIGMSLAFNYKSLN